MLGISKKIWIGGGTLAIEQIKLIREVEEKADQIRRKSNSEAKQKALDAEKEASILLEQANKKADEIYKDAIAKAEEEASETYNEVIQKAKGDCAKISSQADKNMDKAIAIIVGRVVS
jgi:vacuolar-type H+-ATPase subunit H